jgi:hypothetical protein
MNRLHVDDLATALAGHSTRRDAVRILATAVFGMGSAALLVPEEIAAKKKKKRKKRQQRIIVDPGPTDSPPGALGCTRDAPYDTRCPYSTNPNDYCWVSVAGAPICGTGVKCFACAADADCIQFTGNARARCAVVPPVGGCLAQNSRSCVVVP